VHEIGEVITRLRGTGLTVLLVEQKLPFARKVASDVRILDKGRLVVSGGIAELTDELVQKHLTV
jgi:urea transport system ATP-binding protein